MTTSRSRPIIGVTPSSRFPDYEQSVRLAGGEPRLLSIDEPASLAGLDGVLFTGGGDIDPSHYHERRHPRTEEPDQRRDAFELSLARLALPADVPVLAICRGLQLINVAAGGTLVQDIPTQVPTSVVHQVTEPLDAIAHSVAVTGGSVLAQALQAELTEGNRLAVNSRHHQSASEAGEGFIVSATAPDGVIEAIERPLARFCLGVQWHPENFWRNGRFRSLFEAFLRVAGTDHHRTTVR